MRRLFLVPLVALGLLALPGQASAGVIAGELDLGGGVVVDANTANWFQTLTGPGCPCNPQSVNVVGSTITDGGVDAGILAGTTLVHETNLNFTTFPPGPINPPFDMFEFPCTAGTAPGDCNGTNPVAAPPIDFQLTHINTCAENGGTVGVSCFGNAPFLFQEFTVGGTTKTSVTLNLAGNVFDTNTPNLVSTWTGSFTGQFNGSIAQLFAIIETGGSIQNSFSATKIVATPVAAVPEPATLLLFGTGTALVARRFRKGKKKS